MHIQFHPIPLAVPHHFSISNTLCFSGHQFQMENKQNDSKTSIGDSYNPIRIVGTRSGCTWSRPASFGPSINRPSTSHSHRHKSQTCLMPLPGPLARIFTGLKPSPSNITHPCTCTPEAKNYVSPWSTMLVVPRVNNSLSTKRVRHHDFST
jgi:hypothetical protein